MKVGGVNTIKAKFIKIVGFLDVTNNFSEQLTFCKKESLGILCLGSIGYYEVKQRNAQHHLKTYYEFIALLALFKEFKKLTNTLWRKEQKSTDSYLWLVKNKERRNLSDKEILEKYANLETWCLAQKENDEPKEMLKKCKDIFNLINEIATFPNIEAEIDMVENLPFLIRPCHIKKEDKQTLDRELKRLVHLGMS